MLLTVFKYKDISKLKNINVDWWIAFVHAYRCVTITEMTRNIKKLKSCKNATRRTLSIMRCSWRSFFISISDTSSSLSESSIISIPSISSPSFRLTVAFMVNYCDVTWLIKAAPSCVELCAQRYCWHLLCAWDVSHQVSNQKIF